ncbi:U3 small nucleolar RNA-associated protein NOL7-like [Haliotis asinina]|uniref:U3 small nucleolar RNA-associated protein NOL7-like n=1 Tax=Haliotis asinina TaxID=109174 RepID=UPI003531C5AA
MPRGRRALIQRPESDDEFETPAFRDIGKDDQTKETEESDSEADLVEAGGSSEEGSSDDEEELELADDDGANDEDDSDAAPEDVGFSESRATALSQMKQAMTQMKKEKLQLKAKRKQRDEKFKEQKRIKLEALSRLPDEILDSLPEKLNEERKVAEKGKKKKGEKKHKAKKEDPDKKKHVTVFEETEDYIPLETGFIDSETGIKAMPLKDLRKRMAISQSAANFRNSRLYGDHRRRESTQAYLAKLEKRKARLQKR